MAGITFQNTNWLGDAISSAYGDTDPGKLMLTAEQIKLARVKQAAEQQALDQARLQAKAAEATGNAYADALPTAGPTTGFTPSLPSVDDGKWSMEQMDTINIPQTWTDPAGAAQFSKDRAASAAAMRQAALTGKSAKDIAEAFPYLRSQATVALNGVPEDASTRNALQFGTTGKFAETDETKTPLKNWVVPNGGPSGMTRNGTTDLSGRPLPQGAVVAGQADIDPNVYGDQKNAINALVPLAQKVNAGQDLTHDEAERARVLIDTAFPKSLVQSQQGGRTVNTEQRSTPIPDWLGRTSGLIDAFSAGRHLEPAPTGAAPVPYMGATGMGMPPPSAMPQAAAQPAAPAASPVLPGNVPRVVSQGPGDPAVVRKEIMSNSQAFSDYANSINPYNAIVSAATAPQPTNQTDLNIVYGIAKIMDPGSVVRESETKMAGGSGTAYQQLEGMFNKLAAGGGLLSPEVRANLIDQARFRMAEYNKAWQIQKDFYSTKIAPSMGVDPTLVIPPVPEMMPFNLDELRAKPQPPPSAPVSPGATTPAAAAQPVDHNAVKRLLGMQ